MIPGLGRPREEEVATHPSVLARIILWTEKPGRFCPQGPKESDTTEATQHECKENI